MPIKTRQFALAANTATSLLNPNIFSNTAGAATDPIPVILKNEDTAAVMWIGGPDVTTTQGQSLQPGQAEPMALYNGDVPFAYTTAVSNPIISVMVGRQ